MFNVTHEPRLIDRSERADTHRCVRELPEIGHQVRMAVRGQALAAGFATVIGKVRFGEPPLEKGAGIDARRGVGLKVDEVFAAGARGLARVSRAEKVVEPDFEEIGDRRVSRNMAAQLGVLAVGPHHHRERIPAHDGDDSVLDVEVSGILRLVRKRDGIAVGGVQHRRQRHAPGPRVIQELAQDEGRALAAFGLALAGCGTVFWNGTLGVAEFPAFARGSLGLAQKLSELPATVVVGGGETAALVEQAGLRDRFSHVSTGGGASLEFLEGRTLPGVAALDDAAD